MGIPALWDLIKEQDRSEPLVQLAEEHYRNHGRPLRIAIDEADWRFNNLTPQQVSIIREKSNKPYQGIEKTMFFRICRWLSMNIQPLFVFDGPSRPWKRGKRGGNKINYEERRLLQEMLRYFRIPYHEAPGEAEAECARMQQLGIVDAVFSQDSDTLMFGCDLLIRDDRVAKQKGSEDRSKENTQKSATSVRVVRAAQIQQAHGFDRDGLVLFAMLAGGDYDTKGLDRCGSAMALKAVKAGLGRNLCRCRTERDCVAWREELVSWLQTQRSYHGHVPIDFPDIKTLTKYNTPKVSTDEQLLHLRGLRNGWDQPLDELKLLDFTGARFDIWGRLYLRWIAPVLFTKLTMNGSLRGIDTHQIKLVNQRFKPSDDGTIPRPLERKLTFSPFGLTTLTRSDFEGGDRRGYWEGARDKPFDPSHRVEETLPSFVLELALPADFLSLSPKAPKNKRKRQGGPAEGSSTPTAKRSRRPRTPTLPVPTMERSLESSPLFCPESPVRASGNFRSEKARSLFDSSPLFCPESPVQKSGKSRSRQALDTIEISDSDEPLEEIRISSSKRRSASIAARRAAPVPFPTNVSATPLAASGYIDLGSETLSLNGDEDDDLEAAIRMSLSELITPTPPAPSSKNPDDIADLRARRLRHFESAGIIEKERRQNPEGVTRLERPARNEKGRKTTEAKFIDCIDLTSD